MLACGNGNMPSFKHGAEGDRGTPISGTAATVTQESKRRRRGCLRQRSIGSSDELILLQSNQTSKWSLLEAFCWALCWPPRPSRVVGKLAFYPPEFSTYEFVCESEEHGTYKIRLREDDVCSVDPKKLLSHGTGYLLKSSASGNRIAGYLLVQQPPFHSHYVILLSHANACDLGQIIDLAWLVSSVTGCDFLLYDYSGFGLSCGDPGEKNLYDDHEAAFKFLIRRVGNPRRIILFGQSIGTAAAVELASRIPVAGVILEAPLLSGCRAMFEDSIVETCCAGRFLDPFQSEKRANKLLSPTLIIHGKQDSVVPCKHGQKLHQLAPFAVEPLFIAEAGHCDLALHKEYYHRIKRFIHQEVPEFWSQQTRQVSSVTSIEEARYTAATSTAPSSHSGRRVQVLSLSSGATSGLQDYILKYPDTSILSSDEYHIPSRTRHSHSLSPTNSITVGEKTSGSDSSGGGQGGMDSYLRYTSLLRQTSFLSISKESSKLHVCCGDQNQGHQDKVEPKPSTKIQVTASPPSVVSANASLTSTRLQKSSSSEEKKRD